jgi:transcriptional regulator EpsA
MNAANDSIPPAEISSARHAELVMRVIEPAREVLRRHQFFIWAQSYLQMLLPHDVSVCAAYQRRSKSLAFDTFHNVPLATDVLHLLGNARSALLEQVQGLWIERSGGALRIDLADLQARVPGPEVEALQRAGFHELLVHGVARPQRPRELESFFMLMAAGRRWTPEQCSDFDLLLPHLHTTYVRTQVNETELGLSPVTPPAPVPQGAVPRQRAAQVTERERQILRRVREGETNAEIGLALKISPLTVKNHVQKILRKLDAANRAQAVALAMQQNIL